MKPARIVVIAIAAVAAVGLAVVVRAMNTGRPTTVAAAAPAPDARPMARVLVAKRDLVVGARLTAGDMEWKEWPIDGLNPAYVVDGRVAPAPAADAPAVEKAGAATAEVTRVAEDMAGQTPKSAFVGAVVREQMLAGEPIIARKIVRSGDSGYMAAILEPGMRAMSMRVSVETAAGGFILPGDRVDVLLTREQRLSDVAGAQASGRSRFTSAIVMQNVKVLAIDQTTTTSEEHSVVGATATLELGPRDAEALALAKSEGELSMVLRSYADANGPSGRVAPPRAQSAAIRVFREGRADVVVTQ